MINEIVALARILNSEHILWGVGGSVLLKSYGIVDEVHDLDILISENDIEKAVQLLDTIADRQTIPIKDEYKTQFFYVYNYKGISIDVMSLFRISHSSGVYEFILDKASIVKVEEHNKVLIPFTSLEDWFIAYSLMIGREEKVRMIEAYFKSNGVAHPHLLERGLNQILPDSIRKEIELYLN